jgi:hypothetical protein
MRPQRRPLWKEVLPFLFGSVGVWALGVALQCAPNSMPQSFSAEWQRSFRELAAPEQRLFRQVRESLYDIERLRAETGRWPEPSTLADEGVEPFRADDAAFSLAWQRSQNGLSVTYLGVPTDGGVSWLVLFIEPTPTPLLAQAPVVPEDEEHHTLPDGTPVHVTVWTHSAGAAPLTPDGLVFPAAQGWLQRTGGE